MPDLDARKKGVQLDPDNIRFEELFSAYISHNLVFEKLGETALIHRRIGSFERAALLRSLVQTKTSLSVSSQSGSRFLNPIHDHVHIRLFFPRRMGRSPCATPLC